MEVILRCKIRWLEHLPDGRKKVSEVPEGMVARITIPDGTLIISENGQEVRPVNKVADEDFQCLTDSQVKYLESLVWDQVEDWGTHCYIIRNARRLCK